MIEMNWLKIWKKKAMDNGEMENGENEISELLTYPKLI